MIAEHIDTYPTHRLRSRVALLLGLILVLIVVALLSHKMIHYNEPVWKSSPYGQPRDTGTVKAGH